MEKAEYGLRGGLSDIDFRQAAFGTASSPDNKPYISEYLLLMLSQDIARSGAVRATWPRHVDLLQPWKKPASYKYRLRFA